MKTVIVYDSVYGNTEQIAKTIAQAIGTTDEVELRRAGDVPSMNMRSIDLLIVGSPTQGGRPTPAVQAFLKQIPASVLGNVGVAAFDTRLLASEKGFGLRLVMRIVGYAAPRIARALQGKGGQLVARPEGFIVEDTKGLLKEGELDRAAIWAAGVLQRNETAKRR
jgi:flavodoxin